MANEDKLVFVGEFANDAAADSFINSTQFLRDGDYKQPRSDPFTGYVYKNTTSGNYRIWTGSAWDNMGAPGVPFDDPIIVADPDELDLTSGPGLITIRTNRTLATPVTARFGASALRTAGVENSPNGSGGGGSLDTWDQGINFDAALVTEIPITGAQASVTIKLYENGVLAGSIDVGLRTVP